MTWNHRRFPKQRFFRELSTVDFRGADLVHEGWLLTTGNAGSLLIGPVWHDNDLYKRPCESRGTVYGSISLMEELGMEAAEILSWEDLFSRVLEEDRYLRLRHHLDNGEVAAAMLSLFPDPAAGRPRGCGIVPLADGNWQALNPELPARYNEPRVRYSLIGTAPELRSRVEQALADVRATRLPETD